MEVKVFESLDAISSEVVEWLLGGTETYPGGYRATRCACYRTRRGARKRACALVNPATDRAEWYSTNGRGGWKPLTAEERRVFDAAGAAVDAEKKAAEKAERAKREAARRAAGRPVAVGDVFEGSYGYEALLSEFYEVVAVEQGGRVAVVRRIAEERDYDGFGYDTWFATPCPHEFVGEARRRVVKWDGEEPSIRINDFITASRIDPSHPFRNYDYH